MTLDLFSFLPEPEGNYATRKIHQLILADPLLYDRSRDIILRRRRKGQKCTDVIGEELLRLVMRFGRDGEPPGLFRELIDDGLTEVVWSDLVAILQEELLPSM